MDVGLAAALAVAGLMFAGWLLSLAIRDVSIIDILWGLGFVAVAWAAFAVTDDGSDARRILLVVLITVWGLRLAGYLGWRNIGEEEDFRYRAMRAKHGTRFPLVSLVTVFLLQGVIMWIVSLPVQQGMEAASPDGLRLLDFLGLAVWAVGLTFEAAGDLQLARFKSDAANRGKVMDHGLWRYTRHPNYFGDFMVWWGIYLIALSTGDAWWTIVSPLVMSVLLMRVSGVGMLEKTIGERRPGYADYKRRTSTFFPRPPRP